MLCKLANQLQLRPAFLAERGVRRIVFVALGAKHRSGAKFVQQCLRVFQVGGIEALGEPAVERGEQIAAGGGIAARPEHLRQAHRRAQFPRFCTHLLRQRDRLAEIGFGEPSLSLFLLQFAAHPESLRPEEEFFGVRLQGLLGCRARRWSRRALAPQPEFVAYRD